jgi:hypothetical protein
MATTTTVSSNYAGKVAGAIIGASFREADAIRSGAITLLTNVNYKTNLRRIRYTDGTVNYACGFTPAGAIVLNERVLEPKKLMNPLRVCKEDFRQTWSEDSMGASAWNDNAPADIMEAITAEVLADTAARTDSLIWTGDNSEDGEFGGFIPLFEADGAVIKPAGIGAAITEANVETELKKVLAAIPVALRRKDVRVNVSPDVFQAYWFYLVSKGIANDGSGQPKEVRFGKYILLEQNGLPDNTIVVAEPKNLVAGTGLLADHNELKLVDEDEVGLLSGLVRGKMVYNFGVNYYNSEDIVYYVSTAAAPSV